MSTDDRDIESSNPSKNFKVGDFDQRSGFFTPVWESKRRIRSEPPVPPSSASGSSPGGRSRAAEAAPAVGPSKGDKGPARGRSGGGKSKRAGSARTPTPLPPSAAAPTAAEGAPATQGAAPLPPAVAAVFDPAIELEPTAASSSLTEASAPGDSVEQPSVEAPARPSAAARALRDAGPDLPPAAFLDAEPEFREGRHGFPHFAAPAEERTDRSPVHQRSLRATSAAARVHEQLKAKLQAEAAELDQSRYDQAPDSQLPPLPAQDENDPYPQSLLRRLRRTIRLSTPVPDPVRSLISKYDRG